MAIKKFSRPISFLFFIEYGAFSSVVSSVFFKVNPKDEYAGLARTIGAGLLTHAFLCVVMMVVTAIAVHKRLKLDTMSATLYAMLGALASLLLALLFAAALYILPAFFSSGGGVERIFHIVAVAGYLAGLVLPYFLIVGRLRKKPSFTAE